ncbi:MAG TPA: bifunctional diaminohydroxyphosphoribosylaminopyrimidine deaminase/5-amino-6-(5-phosphoribosylamino)uracil reductase RibD [Candidatus Sulfotelmatobacter sp.]|nr:bifunctional diaminohydroxyphosphoribosylaminopyrimidine deaminase/5-amino-6-(5-phosphoribosylamino)uracil reductase RibD [Candidatus Sulfotelmatobacter sp.]
MTWCRSTRRPTRIRFSTNTVDNHDLHFMEHALDLAGKSVGLASPNPTVGCVIAKDGAIVGEGFHQYEWRDHAEIVTLKQAGERARGATLFVTLEPCNHAGRTGPCTEAIIAAGITRVVAAMEDPNPKTRGSGFARLRSAGIEVATGVLEAEAKKLNEAFACWITTHRPFVTLKSALTLDGQLALPQPRGSKRRLWISSEESRAEVQRMRHASDALLTGIGTILADDPLLTDRSGLPRRRRLLRVILDTRLQISPKARIVQTAEDDLLVFTAASLKSPKARKLQNAGVELAQLKRREGRIDLQAAMKELGKREILSVLLEAGPRLNGAALAAGIVHKFILFYAPKLAGNSGVPFLLSAGATFPHLHLQSFQQFGPDIAIEAYLWAKSV